MNPAKLMASGSLVSICDPNPATIKFSDICDTLANTFRHGGQGKRNVSVAHHLCLGVHLLRGTKHDARITQLWLMHDLHEFLIGEIITPVKAAIKSMIGADVVKWIEHRIDAVLFEIAGIEVPTPAEHAVIKRIDAAVCLYEAAHIAGTDYTNYGYDPILLQLAEVHLGHPDGDTAAYRMFCEMTSIDGWDMAFATMVATHLPALFNWEGEDAASEQEYLRRAAVAMMDEHTGGRINA